MTSFKFLKRKNVGVHRTNFKMKSFHSSHLLFHLFNEQLITYQDLHDPPALASTPSVTPFPAFLPLAQATPSTQASLLSFYIPLTLPAQGFQIHSSLCMESSSPRYLHDSLSHSLQISAQVSFYQRGAILGHLVQTACSTPISVQPPYPT